MVAGRNGQHALRTVATIYILLCAVAVTAKTENDERDAKEGLPVQYGLMIDAGSTGSRVHLYRWVWRGQALPDITDDYYLEVKPGLSSYAHNPQEAADSIKPLLDFSLNHIPEAVRETTWVKLTATAGLRLLTEEQQDGILAAVRAQFHASPFEFEDDWVKISEGIDEAVDAWLSANYIMESVVHDDPGSTVGTLDLGGGSMQIACRPTGNSTIHVDTEYRVGVAGNAYDMYAISHLSYGLMQARRRIDALVQASAAPGATHVDHPCLLSGTNISFHDGTEDGVQHAMGTSDHAACLALQEQIFHGCAHAIGDKCSPMHSVPPPDTKGRFLAFSYFYDVLTEFLHTHTPTVGEIREAAQRVCGVTHEELHGKHGATYEVKNPEFLKRACQDITYIFRLLQGYLQFQDDHQRIELVKNVRGKEMSWTLGQTLRMLEQPVPGKVLEPPAHHGTSATPPHHKEL
mmetsp:Transcript_24189/g.46860  ORF Transcript_24189/g.46860 Transcript_24189/m.46860 type:complete len:461 (+) Transcript_24189:124-1506(+)